MTRGEATTLTAYLRALYPNNKVDDAAIGALESMLLDVPFAICDRVVRRLAQTSTWFPTWNEIHTACILEIDGPPVTALAAWGDVGEAVRKYGRYQEPFFRNALTAQCVASFGWRNICDSTNEVADRAHFVREYERLAEQEERELSRFTLAERQVMRMGANNTKLFPLPWVMMRASFETDHRDFDESEAANG